MPRPLGTLLRLVVSALVVALGLFASSRTAWASGGVGACEESEGVASGAVVPVITTCLALIEAGNDFDALPGFCSPRGTSDVAPPPMAPFRDGGTIAGCDDGWGGDQVQNGLPSGQSTSPDADTERALPLAVGLAPPVRDARITTFAPPAGFVPDGVRSRVDRPPTR